MSLKKKKDKNSKVVLYIEINQEVIQLKKKNTCTYFRHFGCLHVYANYVIYKYAKFLRFQDVMQPKTFIGNANDSY